MVKSFLISLTILLAVTISAYSQTAPDFTVTDYNNVTHKLYEDYLNQGKTVMIKVFFVNCPPCVSISPDVQALYEEWGEGNNDVQFIELSNKSFDSNADVKNYSQNLNLSFPGVGEDGGALDALEPYLTGQFGPFFGTPTFIVIAPDGQVNYDVDGAGNAGKIAAIDQALEDTGAQKPGTMVLPSSFSIQVEDAFGQGVNNIDYVLGSATNSTEYPVDLNNGTFQITDIATEYPGIINPVIRARKNDDLQSNLSVTDILVIVRHILGLVSIDDSNLLIAADTNGDGSINAVDLLTLQRAILGLITEFPGTDSYILQPEEIPLNLVPGQLQSLSFTAIKVGDLNGN